MPGFFLSTQNVKADLVDISTSSAFFCLMGAM